MVPAVRRFPWIPLGLSLLAGCGPRSMEARIERAENRSDKVSAKLDDAEKAFKGLEPDDADAALQKAHQMLADKDMELYPETVALKDRLARDEATLPLVRAAREKRDLEKAIEERKA